MKIAMIGQKGMPAIYGGVERHVHELATRVVQSGHEVTVYSRSWYTGRVGEYETEGVHIKHMKSLKTKHLDTITHTFFATLHATAGNYDVIHYHGIGPSLLSWIPRLFSPKTKIVTTFHSIDRYHDKWNVVAKFFLRLGERTACAFAHQTITVSRSLHQYCLNEFGKSTTYIPNAVPAYMHEKKSEAHTRSFGLTKGNYLVMVSRLVRHKGAHLLIQAFSNLKNKYPDHQGLKDMKLAIVGGSAYTNDYVRELHKHASVCNDIVFTDFQSGETLNELYINSKALIHPSLNEGLPITVLQAMSYGVPVLVSDIPEHLEIVKDPRIVFNENNIEAIEKAILDFLSLEQTAVSEITELHASVIEDSYSWDVVIPKILELYEHKNTRAPALGNVGV